MGELVFAPRTAWAAKRLVEGADQLPAACAEEASGWAERPTPLPECERLWRRLWNDAPGIGWQRLQKLQHHFGSLELAWRACPDALWQALAGSRWGHRRQQDLLDYRQGLGPTPISTPPSAEQRRRWGGARCLVWGEASLPASLLNLERPPLQLHWQGQGSLWACLRRRQAVAVVGTRHPSRHGETIARQIGRALAEAGWPVVSGLAEGIDAAAHEGCLEGGGHPVGVLGTPLERVYPRHHSQLQQHVAAHGLLVSELPAGTPVRAGHFAARNRLQVALARAVVLVECPQRSGALHSAEMAWAEGIPLWAVPADTNRASATGSNRWLGQGATAQGHGGGMDAVRAGCWPCCRAALGLGLMLAAHRVRLVLQRRRGAGTRLGDGGVERVASRISLHPPPRSGRHPAGG